MSERTRYDASCEVIGGVRSTVELEEAAQALNDGSYGWSVSVERRGHQVRMRLISRLFDGERFVVDIATEQLAQILRRAGA